jgi:hypothetical protein
MEIFQFSLFLFSFYLVSSARWDECFYPRWYVCTTRVYVLLCCCSCSCWHGHINQNTALLSNFTMVSAYFCTIAYSLARQPCARLPAALRALARQPCARCCPDKSKLVQQNLRALLSRQVWTRSAEYYTILRHAFMSGFTVHNEL